VARALGRTTGEVRLAFRDCPLLGCERIGNVFGCAAQAEVTVIVTPTVGFHVEELFDPSEAATEYAPQVFQKLKELDGKHAVDPNYMSRQTDINARMRGILIDWLVQVHHKFDQNQRVLFSTVEILDRYLACTHVRRSQLQTVGVACLCIAIKMFGSWDYKHGKLLDGMCWVTEYSSTEDMVKEFEAQVMTKLGFNLISATACEFLDIFSKANRSSERQRAVEQIVLEFSLISIEVVSYPPSMVAAATVMLCNKFMGCSQAPTLCWPETMVAFSGHSYPALKPCGRLLCSLVEKSSQPCFDGVRRKHSKRAYGNATALLDEMISELQNRTSP